MQIKKYIKTDPKIFALCLYRINKAAKQHRDSQENMANGIYHRAGWAEPLTRVSGYGAYAIGTSCHHQILQNCKRAKERMYMLKNQAINYALQHGWVVNGEWHRFDGDLFASVVKISNFRFHYIPMSDDELKMNFGEKKAKQIIKKAKYLESMDSILREGIEQLPTIRTAETNLGKLVNFKKYIPKIKKEVRTNGSDYSSDYEEEW